jgi:Arc/MetJ-type ribon-helix-helix transcriptional regulator
MFMRMMITFNFHMPPAMHGDLQRVAHQRGQSAAEVVRRALQRVLDDELESAGSHAAAGFGGAVAGGGGIAAGPAAPTESAA